MTMKVCSAPSQVLAQWCSTTSLTLCGNTTGWQTYQHDNEGLFSSITTVSTMVQNYELNIVWEHYRMADISSK